MISIFSCENSPICSSAYDINIIFFVTSTSPGPSFVITTLSVLTVAIPVSLVLPFTQQMQFAPFSRAKSRSARVSGRVRGEPHQPVLRGGARRERTLPLRTALLRVGGSVLRRGHSAQGVRLAQPEEGEWAVE